MSCVLVWRFCLRNDFSAEYDALKFTGGLVESGFWAHTNVAGNLTRLVVSVKILTLLTSCGTGAPHGEKTQQLQNQWQEGPKQNRQYKDGTTTCFMSWWCLHNGWTVAQQTTEISFHLDCMYRWLPCDAKSNLDLNIRSVKTPAEFIPPKWELLVVLMTTYHVRRTGIKYTRTILCITPLPTTDWK